MDCCAPTPYPCICILLVCFPFFNLPARGTFKPSGLFPLSLVLFLFELDLVVLTFTPPPISSYVGGCGPCLAVVFSDLGFPLRRTSPHRASPCRACLRSTINLFLADVHPTQRLHANLPRQLLFPTPCQHKLRFIRPGVVEIGNLRFLTADGSRV